MEGRIKPNKNKLVSYTTADDYRGLSDVFIQDQSTPIVDYFLTRKLGDAELAVAVEFDDREITLVAGHGFVVGNMIEIDDGDKLLYQSRVLGVTGDVISVANPVCYPFAVTANVRRVTQDGNVVGSPAAPIIYSIKPPPGVEWDINILSVNMLDGTVMDDATFGGIAGPINGVVYRVIDGDCNNIFTAVDNSCFIRHCDWAMYSDKAPAGQYGFNAKRYFNSQTGDGVSVRIGGADVAEFQAVIAADISGLNRFWNVVRGHVVEP